MHASKQERVCMCMCVCVCVCVFMCACVFMCVCVDVCACVCVCVCVCVFVIAHMPACMRCMRVCCDMCVGAHASPVRMPSVHSDAASKLNSNHQKERVRLSLMAGCTELYTDMILLVEQALNNRELINL